MKFTLRIKTQIAAFDQRRMHNQAATVAGENFFRGRQIIADDFEIGIVASLLKPAFGDFAPEYFWRPQRKTQANIDSDRAVYAIRRKRCEFQVWIFLKTEILVAENHPAIVAVRSNIGFNEVIISFGNPDVFLSIIVKLQPAVC